MGTEKQHTDDLEDRPWSVVYADRALLESKNYGRVAHLPFIFTSRHNYHRLSNRFLIDLGTGVWDLSKRGAQMVDPPTGVSMRTYAWLLADYLRYCDRRGKDPTKVDYVIDLLQGYQREMVQGTWSRDGTPLAASTVNARVNTALMFLQWAGDKGLREPLNVPTVKRTIIIDKRASSGAISTKEVESRRGKIRQPKRTLRLPEDQHIAAWLKRVYSRCKTQGLIAETILETAVRREEAGAWRVDTLPLNPDDWHINNADQPIANQTVLVTLRYGTKGPGQGEDHGDKIGPEGTIHVPMPLALKLHEYRQKVRPHALRSLLKHASDRREYDEMRANAVHLFLHPDTGQRYSGQQIYDFWTAPAVDCPPGWAPHRARDWWACSQLMRHLAGREEMIKQAQSAAPEDRAELAQSVIKSDAVSFIQLVIQQQLRHQSSQTSMIYLQFAQDKLRLNLNLLEKYEQGLDENDPPVWDSADLG